MHPFHTITHNERILVLDAACVKSINESLVKDSSYERKHGLKVDQKVGASCAYLPLGSSLSRFNFFHFLIGHEANSGSGSYKKIQLLSFLS